MIVVKGWWAIAVVAFLIIRTSRAQYESTPTTTTIITTPEDIVTDGKTTPENIVTDGDSDDGFIVPDKQDDDVDKFTYESDEYLVVNKKRRYKTASLSCKMDYSGELAFVPDRPLALFLAEALSETNLMMDALWIGGVTPTGNDSDWVWKSDNETIPIDPKLVKTFSKVPDIDATNRNCLAFARLDHDLPDYRALACNAERAYLCVRTKGAGGNNSTHPGWIKLGKRLYKIFSEMVPYDLAASKCFQQDPDAQLAVIINFNFSQLLGRYLLINRPSLENAWIGARWRGGMYSYEPESITLANQSALGGEGPWPPWRNNKIQKTGGCVLLDRHLANTTLFVEARCARNRPYICYKMVGNDTGNDSFTDVIIQDRGYRLLFGQRSWDDALQFCVKYYGEWGGLLVEITSLDIKNDLLYVMGENRTAIQHIWVGGHFYPTLGWVWQGAGAVVNKDILDWVTNDTFNEDVEALNVCLDMDRENHIKGLHYGANCATQQNFVCQFSADKLRELEDYERKRETDRSAK